MIKQLKILFLIIVFLGLFFILFKRKSKVEVKEHFFQTTTRTLGDNDLFFHTFSNNQNLDTSIFNDVDEKFDIIYGDSNNDDKEELFEECNKIYNDALRNFVQTNGEFNIDTLKQNIDNKIREQINSFIINNPTKDVGDLMSQQDIDNNPNDIITLQEALETTRTTLQDLNDTLIEIQNQEVPEEHRAFRESQIAFVEQQIDALENSIPGIETAINELREKIDKHNEFIQPIIDIFNNIVDVLFDAGEGCDCDKVKQHKSIVINTKQELVNAIHFRVLNSTADVEVDISSFPLATIKKIIKCKCIPPNDWDVSAVTDMSNLFSTLGFDERSSLEIFDENISNWNVSNVTNMNAMFRNFSEFNNGGGDGNNLNSWDVSKVTNMKAMFSDCTKFNSNISNWNVSNVTDMSFMFENCTNFNSNISCWNVSNVVHIRAMFADATAFRNSLGTLQNDIGFWTLNNNVGYNCNNEEDDFGRFRQFELIYDVIDDTDTAIFIGEWQCPFIFKLKDIYDKWINEEKYFDMTTTGIVNIENVFSQIDCQGDITDTSSLITDDNGIININNFDGSFTEHNQGGDGENKDRLKLQAKLLVNYVLFNEKKSVNDINNDSDLADYLNRLPRFEEEKIDAFTTNDNGSCRKNRATVCSDNQFETVPLFEGTITVNGDDRICSPISTCPADKFISVTNSATTDTECSPITTCPTNQFINIPAEEGISNNQCSNITTCPVGQFVTVPAFPGISNNQCAPIRLCPDDEFVTVPAIQGLSNHQCAKLRECNFPDEYISTPETPFSNRECTPVSTCDADEFITIPATEFSDNVCKKLTECDSDTHFISRVHSVNSDRICSPISTCPANKFVIEAATRDRDIRCSPINECSDEEFIFQEASVNSDTVCSPITTCPVDSFVHRFSEPKISNTICEPRNCDLKFHRDGKWWAKNSQEINTIKRCDPKGDIAIKINVISGFSGNFDINTINVEPVDFSKIKVEPIIPKNFLTLFSEELYIGLNEIRSNNPFAHNIQTYYSGISSDYSVYLFDLRIHKEEFKKHKYLDFSKIEDILTNKDNNENVYLFVLGKTETQKMKLFNSNHCIFTIIYQNSKDDEISYIFEFLNYDLRLFYEYNQNFNPNNKTNWDNYLISKLTTKPKLIQSVLYENGKDILSAECKILNDDNDEGDPNKFVSKTIFIRESHKTIQTCLFEAHGDTLFECKRLCKKQESCTRTRCNDICNNCTNDEKCMWNQLRNINNSLLLPQSAVIKGFRGNKLVKITWVKPASNTDIENYYIIVTSPSDTEFLEIHSFKDNRELLDYIVPNLNNDTSYNFVLFTKNTIGVGSKSNIVTVIPNENSDIQLSVDDSFSNSLENQRKIQGDKFKLNKKISNFEKERVIKDLKKIIEKDLNIIIGSMKNLNINVV